MQDFYGRNQTGADRISRAGEVKPITTTRRDGIARAAEEKLGLTVPEAAALSSLGQTSIYKAIREGRLTARKYGTRTIIARADLQAFLDTLPQTKQ